MPFETLTVRKEGAVLFVDIAAPPMNLLEPELVRDLVSLIQRAEADDAVQVLVFKSADPDYFISHVDVTRIKEYRDEAAKLTGEASIALLFRHLSASRLVTIAQIEGRARGAGSEFVLACDMRFAARESAIFSQMEPAFGLIPGGGGVQHLARLMGRARALEVMLSAEDYDAELAERYGWINRALPADALGDFVRSLAHRIAGFPSAGHVAVKDRVNAIAIAPAEDFRRDSDLFGEGVHNFEAQSRIRAAMKRRLPDSRREASPGPDAGRPSRSLTETRTHHVPNPMAMRTGSSMRMGSWPRDLHASTTFRFWNRITKHWPLGRRPDDHPGLSDLGL
jgi:enoyl-CoA hydratase/carnithine racemase